MIVLLSAIYLLLFSFLAWKNFRLALGFFVIALPTYLIRHNIGPFPTTLLELTFGLIFLVWLVKYGRQDIRGLRSVTKKHRLFFILFIVFFISSIAGVFVSDMWYASLGQWRAYFLEPMIIFLILIAHNEKIKDLAWFLMLSTVSISVVAIIQKLTGQLYPPSLWDDQLFGRATSFFTSPNAVGLYLAPILVLGLVVARSEATKQSHSQTENVPFISKALRLLRRPAVAGLLAMTMLSIFAILFSFSQGAWIALGAGVVVLLYFLDYKKITSVVILAGIVVTLVIPPIRTAVLFQDKASQNRLTLWNHSATFLTASPVNFVFGAGIRQYFRKVEKPYYNPKEMERLIYPHNILLNFWTETGFFGMLSFVGILAYSLYLSLKIRKKDLFLGTILITVLTVFIVHGLVDVPYFKNDLSMLFWVIIGAIFCAYNENFASAEVVGGKK